MSDKSGPAEWTGRFAPVIGDYISLVWDGVPAALFVRGHVPVEQAVQTIEEYHGGNTLYRDPVPTYARWSCQPTDDGTGQVLRTYDSPGRGRFPVMRATVVAITVDWAAWHERREGTQWKAGRKVPIIPLEERCACDEASPTECTCGGDCPCHWWPRKSLTRESISALRRRVPQ